MDSEDKPVLYDWARNRRIALLVMKGYSCREVGEMAGLSAVRIREIACVACLKALGIPHDRDTNLPLGLTQLRKQYKNRLVAMFTPKTDDEEVMDGSDQASSGTTIRFRA